jgi:hypothetical protein
MRRGHRQQGHAKATLHQLNHGRDRRHSVQSFTACWRNMSSKVRLGCDPWKGQQRSRPGHQGIFGAAPAFTNAISMPRLVAHPIGGRRNTAKAGPLCHTLNLLIENGRGLNCAPTRGLAAQCAIVSSGTTGGSTDSMEAAEKRTKTPTTFGHVGD